MEDVANYQFQLATTATLARLEQRATDHHDRAKDIEEAVRHLSERVRSLEDARTSSKAVLGFSRSAAAAIVAGISAAVAVIARLIG